MHGTALRRRPRCSIASQTDDVARLVGTRRGPPRAGRGRWRSTSTGTLRARELTTAISVHALEDEFPAVVGWHPWFRRTLGRGAAASSGRLDATTGSSAGTTTSRRAALRYDPADGPFDDAFVVPDRPCRGALAGRARARHRSDAGWFVVFDELRRRRVPRAAERPARRPQRRSGSRRAARVARCAARHGHDVDDARSPATARWGSRLTDCPLGADSRAASSTREVGDDVLDEHGRLVRRPAGRAPRRGRSAANRPLQRAGTVVGQRRCRRRTCAAAASVPAGSRPQSGVGGRRAGGERGLLRVARVDPQSAARAVERHARVRRRPRPG